MIRNRAALFVLSLAIVLLEVILTRLFSVTMWYHFAFLAISVAMFGMTAGALVVYLRPGRFEDPQGGMARHALYFGVSAVGAMLVHLAMPFVVDLSLTGLFVVVATLAVLAGPFVFGGVAVTLALTRFPGDVAGLYACDLAGAALACAAAPALLARTDAPTIVVLVGALGASAAALFAAPESRRGRGVAAAVAVLGCAFVAGNTALYQGGTTLLKVLWRKDQRVERPLFERWNSLSLVQVFGDPQVMRRPAGWGLSERAPAVAFPQLMMLIDGTAGTTLSNMEGKPAATEHLKWDVTSVAHHLRERARVLVVGVGGGRDVQAALAFGQSHVTGVEINPACLEVVTGPFADFVGGFHADPRVRLVNDEARSWLARSDERFDILQISLIDTWAATAAGAFVLSENSLYTVEAWKLFLSRLSPGGVLSVSRWAHPVPVETMRTLTLAAAALRATGVREPRAHVMVAYMYPVSTVLVSPTPFTRADADRLERVCASRGFRVVLDPFRADPPSFADLVAREELDARTAAMPFDLSAPSDDRPFFFQTLKLSAALDSEAWSASGMEFNAYAVVTLVAVLAVVLLLGAFTVLVPLLARRRGAAGSLALVCYFTAIGLGFMLIEGAQIQRLSILLGHPTYALTVVLGTLLASSGAGSLCASRVAPGARTRAIAWLIGVLALTGAVAPFAVHAGEGLATPWRIALAIAMMAPAGVLMGLPFALGMARALATDASAGPWLFALNGAASITASVLAVTISLAAGTSWAFWAGVASYAVAFGASAAIGDR